MLYILSDTHLSLSTHKPMDIFGARWKDHDRKIEAAWRERITGDDTVIIGGDISWGISLDQAGDDLRLIGSLPGRKILLRGNHDYWWSTLAKNEAFLAENGISGITFLQNNAIADQGFVICGTRGWYNDSEACPQDCDYDKIVAREVLRLKMSLDAGQKLAGERIVIFHFPPVFGGYVCRELVDVLHEYGITRVFYGHIHGKYRIPGVTGFEGIVMTLCSADFLNFIPLAVQHGENPALTAVRAENV